MGALDVVAVDVAAAYVEYVAAVAEYAAAVAVQ